MLKASCLSILMVATGAACLAADQSGTWKVTFDGPLTNQPKTVAEITFDLQVAGESVAGTAHMGSWPGKAALIGGRLDGDHIRFTAIGKFPWSSSTISSSASGYPKLKFDGKIEGRKIHLTVTWGNVMISGEAPADRVYEMSGEKVAEAK